MLKWRTDSDTNLTIVCRHLSAPAMSTDNSLYGVIVKKVTDMLVK